MSRFCRLALTMRTPFQFRLRSLLLVVALFCLCLGRRVDNAHHQKEAVALIEAERGEVKYDYQFGADGTYQPDAPEPGPSWLLGLIGIDYFADVVSVHIHKTIFEKWKQVDDPPYLGQLRYLGSLRHLSLAGVRLSPESASIIRPLLPQLDVLRLSNCDNVDAVLTAFDRPSAIEDLDLAHSDVSNSGLVSLHGMPHLKSLSLMYTNVSDDSLTHVYSVTSLRSLTLFNTPITSSGIEAIDKLINLQHLSLGNTKVDDAGLRHLLALSRLDTLDLDGTPITDAALTTVSELRSLRSLGLDDTNLTDEGISHLSALPKLAELSLDGTHITDSGLSTLAAMRSLIRLSTINTNVSQQAAEQLRTALPRCHITY